MVRAKEHCLESRTLRVLRVGDIRARSAERRRCISYVKLWLRLYLKHVVDDENCLLLLFLFKVCIVLLVSI